MSFPWKCNACDRSFLIWKYDNDILCPYCSKNDLEKIITSFYIGSKVTSDNFMNYDDVKKSRAKVIKGPNGEKIKYDPNSHGMGVKGANSIGKNKKDFDDMIWVQCQKCFFNFAIEDIVKCVCPKCHEKMNDNFE